MAHEITLTKNGTYEFVASSHVSVWHTVGQRHEGLMTVEKSMEESNLGFTVSKRDLYTTGNDGEQILVPGRVAIVRDDTDLILSVMSDSYAVIQNEYTAELIKAMVGEGASVATAGSLHGGKKIFFQMEVGDSFFVGDRSDEEVKKFLLVGNSHDGSTAQFMMSTPIRVVCQNTLNAALDAKSKNIVKVYHRKGYASKAQEAVRLLGIADEYYEAFKASANKLIQMEISSTYVDGFINALIPAEADENGEIATRTANRRDEIKALFAGGMGNHGKTRWDLFNAVTEFVDHKQGGRVTQKRMNLSDASINIEAEQRLERAIFGAGATLKQKAMDLLLA